MIANPNAGRGAPEPFLPARAPGNPERGGAVPHPFAFTQDDFARIRALIYRKAGIALAPGKKDLVYSRLARRLRARGLTSFAGYLKVLEEQEEQELEEFINALTTNMTSFFREPHHFRILAGHLEKLPKHRPISIWTCASSSGEEPYSIAMTALEALGPRSLRILATDIDTKVLGLAQRGIYPMDQMHKVPQHLLKRFFLRGEGEHEGFAKVREELKNLIAFRRLNLLDAQWPMRGKFDAIFCRNVMIYFDKETQHAVLRKMAPYLQPDGLLFVGHSESFHSDSNLFRLCGNTVYTLR